MYLRPTRPYKAFYTNWAFAGEESTSSSTPPPAGGGSPPSGGGGSSNDPSQHKPSRDWYKKHPFHPQKPKKTKIVVIKGRPQPRRPVVVVRNPPPIIVVNKRKHKGKKRRPDIGECVKTREGWIYKGLVECEDPDDDECTRTALGKSCKNAEENFCKLYGYKGKCQGNPKWTPQSNESRLGNDEEEQMVEEGGVEASPATGAVSGGFDFNNIPMPILLGGGLLVVMMMFMMMRR